MSSTSPHLLRSSQESDRGYLFGCGLRVVFDESASERVHLFRCGGTLSASLHSNGKYFLMIRPFLIHSYFFYAKKRINVNSTLTVDSTTHG